MAPSFVVQKHAATRLHYDFRLEANGVLKSWAIPKGPSLKVGEKRLAMLVDDHALSYATFEGTLPEGSYGAGKVIVWDKGTYEMKLTDFNEGFKKGDIKFVLHGKKLNGEFALFRAVTFGKNSWLLMKKKDEFATKKDVTLNNRSVLSRKKL